MLPPRMRYDTRPSRQNTSTAAVWRPFSRGSVGGTAEYARLPARTRLRTRTGNLGLSEERGRLVEQRFRAGHFGLFSLFGSSERKPLSQPVQAHVVGDGVVWDQQVATRFTAVCHLMRGGVFAPCCCRSRFREHGRVLHVVRALGFANQFLGLGLDHRIEGADAACGSALTR